MAANGRNWINVAVDRSVDSEPFTEFIKLAYPPTPPPSSSIREASFSGSCRVFGMPWQEIVAGLIVLAAVAYLYKRFRSKRGSSGPQGPDVPVSRLKRKRPSRDSCDH